MLLKQRHPSAIGYVRVRPISAWAKFDSGQMFVLPLEKLALRELEVPFFRDHGCMLGFAVCGCAALLPPSEQPKMSLFLFSLPPSIFAIFSLLGSLLVELLPQVVAMAHPKCAIPASLGSFCAREEVGRVGPSGLQAAGAHTQRPQRAQTRTSGGTPLNHGHNSTRRPQRERTKFAAVE